MPARFVHVPDDIHSKVFHLCRQHGLSFDEIFALAIRRGLAKGPTRPLAEELGVQCNCAPERHFKLPPAHETDTHNPMEAGDTLPV